MAKAFIFCALLALTSASGSYSSSADNIVELAASVPDLSTLVTALKAGNLTGALSGTGPFTVFAPTNEAFNKVPKATLAHLLDPKNIKELDAVLLYHVVSGDIHSKDLKPDQRVPTLEGSSLHIDVFGGSGGEIFVNKAKVEKADNDATNGVVHIISEVLIPPTGPTPAPAPPGANHLFFYLINDSPFYPYQRCGDVDAAPRMPAAIFDKNNTKKLQEYIAVTEELYPTDIDLGSLKQGMCLSKGYSKPNGTISITWAPTTMMAIICDKQCRCRYPDCKDVPDDPKAGRWCSLCGPKFNARIALNLYTK